MNKKVLFVLVTSRTQDHLEGSKLVELQHFGQETIVVENKPSITGVVKLLEGTNEDFNKLLFEVGDLWISTNPMFGSWSQYVAVNDSASTE